MGKLTQADLISFQNAILEDYGIKLEGQELYQAAFNLLQFFESLIKFDQEDKTGGSKTIQDNPLNTGKNKIKME